MRRVSPLALIGYGAGSMLKFFIAYPWEACKPVNTFC